MRRLESEQAMGDARNAMADHLVGVLAIAFAGLCGVLPFVLLEILDKWGPL
jgi:hypothetical protein